MVAHRVWYNQGFSIRDALRAVRDGASSSVALLASADGLETPACAAADEAFIEPKVDGSTPEGASAYVDWCLESCASRSVDLFIPGRGKLRIAARREEFERQGTRLGIVAAAETLDRLDDKLAFTRAAERSGLPVPETYNIVDSGSFAEAVERLRSCGHLVCVKPRRGVYGAGYWRLSDELPLFDRLMAPDDRVIPTDTIAAAIAGAADINLLVLEYLPGPETSVDCLAKDGDLLIGIARTKEAGVQRLATSGSAVDLARRAVAVFGLSGLLNVQAKEDKNGELKLLEINTRMSGGCFYTTLVGANLPWWHVALELGLMTENDLPPLSVSGAAIIPVQSAILMKELPAAINAAKAVPRRLAHA